MAEEKKYYWLKLQKDFFKRHDIQIVESMPNGKDYILFYLKMLVESVSHSGHLRFSDTIPYTPDMLATITRTNVDIVKSAIDIFRGLHMLEIMDDQTIFMAEMQKMVGTSDKSTERVQKFREKQLLLSDLKIPKIENHINNKRYGGNYYKVLERDNYHCKNCEDSMKIMIHHIVPYNVDDDETVRIENLVTLCSKCHTSLHNKSDDKTIGLLLDATILESIGFTNKLMKRYETLRNCIKSKSKSKSIELEIDKEIEKDNILYGEIIQYLNQTAGTKFKATDKHKECIRARWNEGYSLDDFKNVIDKKYNEWIGTDQAKFIRPITLFGTKFDGYLNQVAGKTVKKPYSNNPAADAINSFFGGANGANNRGSTTRSTAESMDTATIDVGFSECED